MTGFHSVTPYFGQLEPCYVLGQVGPDHYLVARNRPDYDKHVHCEDEEFLINIVPQAAVGERP